MGRGLEQVGHLTQKLRVFFGKGFFAIHGGGTAPSAWLCAATVQRLFL